MPTEDDPQGEVEWRPGLLDRVRALFRRALVAILGGRGEKQFHRYYHQFLRATGRFGPPEDAVSTATLRAIASRSLTIIDVTLSLSAPVRSSSHVPLLR